MEMSSNGDGSTDGEIWDGYSDYRTVSSRIGTLVFDAIEAYADIHSIHVEGAVIQPNQAARARSRILAAAMALKAEMSHERDKNEDVAEILKRWEEGLEGSDVDVDVPADGFVSAFRGIRLYDDDPDWLSQFVEDIWRSGWELGYLKAGRREETGPRELEPRDVTKLLESPA